MFGVGETHLGKGTRLGPCCPAATSCLPVCGPRGTDTGRRKAQQESCDFPVAAGQSGEVLVFAAHSFLGRDRTQPCGSR